MPREKETAQFKESLDLKLFVENACPAELYLPFACRHTKSGAVTCIALYTRLHTVIYTSIATHPTPGCENTAIDWFTVERLNRLKNKRTCLLLNSRWRLCHKLSCGKFAQAEGLGPV